MTIKSKYYKFKAYPTIKNRIDQREMEKWSCSIARFEDRLSRYTYLKKCHETNPVYQTLIDFCIRGIFCEVDDFHIHYKNLPDELKKLYDEKKSLDNQTE